MIQTILNRPISTVIIAQNEEECVANAIQSCLPFADEIVVVDGGSKDATVQISQELGCKVYQNPWPGYAKQRNFGADQAQHDWIFFLDADEVADTELATAISAWKKSLEPSTKALSVRRVGDFFGKWLDSRAEAHVRLYDKTQLRIKDVLVHEGPDVKDEPVTLLPGTLWHQGFRDMSDLVVRFNKYTDLDAKQAHLSGKRFNLIRLLLKPPAKFLQQYLWYGMYRQGLAGFTLSSLWSYYIFLKEIKLYEIDWQSKGNTQPEPKDFGLPVTHTHQVQA